MAETIISPGTLATESDNTFITQQPIEAGAAVIGPTVKGPVEIPTIVTSYSEYSNKFGTTFTSGSQIYSYLTSISAYNYFNNGGTSLLITRVTSGSFTPATSSLIPDSGSLNDVFVLETLSEGDIMNNTSTLNVDGSLPSGSEDNVRWQIVSPNITEGTFSLLIRRGDDYTNIPSILETWNNLSLDPLSPNYIEKVIGNQVQSTTQDGTDYYVSMTGTYSNNSKYVRVKQVNLKTPTYLDNTGTAKSEYTASIPIVSSGSFGNAVGSNIPSVSYGRYYDDIDNTNTQGLIGTDYDLAINLLANKDEYKFKYVTTPGLVHQYHSSQLNTLLSNCQNRGDALLLLDLREYGSTLTTTVAGSTSINNSYAATYWPWVQTIDPNTNQQVWSPATTLIPSIYAYTDSTSEVWNAPAGINRGILSNVIRAERKLTQSNRDDLYAVNINPIATFPNSGVTVFGQKTMQKRKSALDRIGVRRLLIELKSTISQIADGLVFEQNTTALRNDFTSQVNPYLSSIQQRQGLNGFRVVMDDTNNTQTTIDNNELIGQIYIQPTRTAEFILLDFNITPTGATFE